MNKEKLLTELETLSALRKNRIRVAEIVLANNNHFLPLLEIIFDVNHKTSIKAAWVFEFVCAEKINLLFPHFDYFFNHIHKVHFDSAVRPITKVCQLLMLKNNKTHILNLRKKHKEQLTEIAFDWMLSKHKVAVKAYTMQTLFLLGKQFDWIHEELKLIIIKNMDVESAAYKARGRMTLLQIEKFNKSK